MPDEKAPDAAAIQAWVVEEIARRLKMMPEAVDVHAPLNGYELDSLEAVTLVGKLDAWLDRRLEPTLLWRYATIAELAEGLAKG